MKIGRRRERRIEGEGLELGRYEKGRREGKGG